MTEHRRVVVTGMGLVTPLGVGLKNNWSKLVESQSGLRAIQSFDVSDLPAKIAGQVPRGDTASGLFNADDWVAPKDQRKIEAGHALSPLLLVRDSANGKVVIADGYHRMCAIYSFDEDALIHCKIV